MRGLDHLWFSAVVAGFIAVHIQRTIPEMDWVWGFILVMAGSTFPDWDLMLGIRFHRSPLTHAAWLPIYTYFFTGDVYSISFFSLGVATHLFLDLVPSGQGLITGILNIFSLKAPGDLRGIPSKLEVPWFLAHGIICIIIGMQVF